MIKRAMDKAIDAVFSNSTIFNSFRDVVHDGYKAEKKLISNHISKDKKTLDFGCGIGQFSPLFSPRSYHGVDTDKTYIRYCKDHFEGKYTLIKESPPYPFKKEFFHQILVSAVIHHIDDASIRAISREFSRILKTDGSILIIDHLTRTNQKNLLCKLLVTLDRGRHFRNNREAAAIFSKEFYIKKTIFFMNGPYRDYALILKKRSKRKMR